MGGSAEHPLAVGQQPGGEVDAAGEVGGPGGAATCLQVSLEMIDSKGSVVVGDEGAQPGLAAVVVVPDGSGQRQ